MQRLTASWGNIQSVTQWNTQTVDFKVRVWSVNCRYIFQQTISLWQIIDILLLAAATWPTTQPPSTGSCTTHQTAYVAHLSTAATAVRRTVQRFVCETKHFGCNHKLIFLTVTNVFVMVAAHFGICVMLPGYVVLGVTGKMGSSPGTGRVQPHRGLYRHLFIVGLPSSTWKGSGCPVASPRRARLCPAVGLNPSGATIRFVYFLITNV